MYFSHEVLNSVLVFLFYFHSVQGELKVHRVWKQGELKETSLIQVSDLTQYI